MATLALEEISKNLRYIKKELGDIREHMVDVDSILTSEDKLALMGARRELKESKAVTLEEFERQLGLA